MQNGHRAEGNLRRLWAWLLLRPWLLLTLVWLLLSLPWLSGIKTIPYDSAQQFYPAAAFTVQQLHQLQGPWWNPYLFGGYPQFADPQMMTFQPSVILPLLLSSLPSLTWFNSIIVLHVLLGGIGGLKLARGYRLDAPAQLLFVLVLMYGAVAASRLQHTPMMVSYAYLPWLWWSLRRIGHDEGWRPALLAGIFGGLCALQMTQLTYLISIAAILYGLAMVMASPTGRLQRALQMLVAGLLALLISSPQWISTFAFLPFSNRMQSSLEAAEAGSLHFASLTTLVSGNFLSHSYGKYWGPGDPSQDYLYLGVVPWVLWLGWGGRVVAAHRRLACIAMTVVVAALVFALGTRTPVFPLLQSWLPGLDLFRRPADALFLMVPAAALLAALALQARLQGETAKPHWPSILVFSILLLYAVGLAISAQQLRALLYLLPVTAIAAITLLLLRGHQRLGNGVIAMLLGLVVLDLAAHNIARRFNATSGSRAAWQPNQVACQKDLPRRR